MSVTSSQIADDLRRLGLPAGAVVALHSSLKSIGCVERGADAVIDAFLYVLGPEGTLLVPTFTYCFRKEDETPVYDRATTPSETGLITETLRNRPEAVRSDHPTHSAAAIGRLAKKLTAEHLGATALGINSPFHRLSLNDGWILLLGCGHNTNSFIHVAEVLAGAAYSGIFCWLHLGWKQEASFKDESGKVRRLAIFECPGDSKAFSKIETELRSNGALMEGNVGEASAQLVKARDVEQTVRRLLEEDEAFLLCDEGTCKGCDVRRNSIGLPSPPPLPAPSTWILDDRV